MRKQVKQKLYFKTMVSFTSYWLNMEKLVTYGLLPKRKRISLGVMFSFFANRKHKKATQSLNYKSPVQFFLLFSLRSSDRKPVPRLKKGISKTPETQSTNKWTEENVKGKLKRERSCTFCLFIEKQNKFSNKVTF